MDKQELLELLKDEDVQNAVGNAVLQAVRKSVHLEFLHFSNSVPPNVNQSEQTELPSRSEQIVSLQNRLETNTLPAPQC